MQGILLNALVRHDVLPQSFYDGSILYVSEMQVHPALAHQGLVLALLRHMERHFGITRTGLLLADPRYNRDPTLVLPGHLSREGTGAHEFETEFPDALKALGYESIPESIIRMADYDSRAVYKLLRRISRRSSS